MNRPMLRSRLIDPGVAYNKALAKLNYGVQLLYERLLDDGRSQRPFRIRPEKIRSIAFPTFRGNITEAMEALCATGLIRRYEVNGKAYGDIPTFLKYQKPHPREARSRFHLMRGQPQASPRRTKANPRRAKVYPRRTLGHPRPTKALPRMTSPTLNSGRQSLTTSKPIQ